MRCGRYSTVEHLHYYFVASLSPPSPEFVVAPLQVRGRDGSAKSDVYLLLTCDDVQALRAMDRQVLSASSTQTAHALNDLQSPLGDQHFNNHLE